jgi:DNA-binding CsgD family transcriptional regulator/predicted enzyme related to lactoylglutathione lyase
MTRTRGCPAHPDVLTPAEWRVLDLIRHGLTRREVARRRGTSIDAVRYHVANISGKLGVSGIPALRLWPGYPSTGAISRAGSKRKDGPIVSATEPQQRMALGPIGQVSLLIKDVSRAEQFYGAQLGLTHLFTFGDLAFFQAGEVRIYLHRKEPADWQASSILYFRVDDIRAAHEALVERGVHFTGAPHLVHTHADGTEEWLAFFEDGQGNALALMATASASQEVVHSAGI